MTRRFDSSNSSQQCRVRVEYGKSSDESPITTKSASIPISKNIPKTPSEIQLCMDEAIADQRDYVFYSRLVKGISMTQSLSQNQYIRLENQVCLSHIINTRNDYPRCQTAADDDWSPGQSNLRSQDYNDFLQNVAANALALAQSDDSEEEEGGIFDLEM